MVVRVGDQSMKSNTSHGTQKRTLMKIGGSKTVEIHIITTPLVCNTSVNYYLIRNSNEFVSAR